MAKEYPHDRSDSSKASVHGKGYGPGAHNEPPSRPRHSGYTDNPVDERGVSKRSTPTTTGAYKNPQPLDGVETSRGISSREANKVRPK
jgi:hypothetical protein